MARTKALLPSKGRTAKKGRLAARPPRQAGSLSSTAAGNGAMSMKAWSAWDAANFSKTRGFIYFPTLNTKKDLDEYTLIQLRQKSRWLYNNVGLAKRIIDGISKMVGSLTPVPQTEDKEWNTLALQSFINNAGADFVFDASGKFNFWSAQIMMTANRLLDGDILAVLTETQSHIARVMFYEAHQIGNAETALNQDQWQTGVRVSPQNRALQYRILTDDNTKSVDVDAADAILHCRFQRPCRQRGEPVMAHAINNLLDRAEILSYIKTGMKVANTIGYQITRSPSYSGPGLPALGTGSTEIDSPQDPTVKLLVEQAYTPGKTPVMAPGEEIKLLLDQRPHPNEIEGMDYLVRDIAWGTDMSPDLLWNIAAVGGADVRYLLADGAKTIEKMQDLSADQFCSRFYIYSTAKELKYGRLPPCKDPEWWKHGWQPEQKITVDITRDGKFYLDMHQRGMISLKRWFSASQGASWQPEVDDYLDERAYIMQGVKDRGMTYDEAFPPAPGASSRQEIVQAPPQVDPTPDSAPTKQVKTAPAPPTQALAPPQTINVNVGKPTTRSFVIRRPDGNVVTGEVTEVEN
jgi:hypothetical protein